MAKREADIPCVPNPECKYWDSPTGCYEDTHHIYKQHDADTPTKKRFCGLYINKLRLCREVHEQLEATVGWPEYPSVEEMQVDIKRFHGKTGREQ